MSRKHKRKSNGSTEADLAAASDQAQSAGKPSDSGSESLTIAWLLLAGVVSGAALLWSYWPTLVAMVHEWINQPDYSHGFLVLPIATYFLWSRRSEISLSDVHPSILGAAALLLAGVLRVVAGKYYLVALDGWTFPLAVGGLVWLLCGQRCLKWALPSIIFLWFMMPIPFSAERWLRVPLQRVATDCSTATLISLGQPAIAEGNVIRLGDHQPLFVEEACSGLRIFVGIFALAFAFVLFSRWSWWQKIMALIAALPIAIVANVIRIVITGMLIQLVSSEAADIFIHDIAGLVMIPLAAVLFWLFLIYLDKLFPEVEEIPYLPTQQSTS